MTTSVVGPLEMFLLALEQTERCIAGPFTFNISLDIQELDTTSLTLIAGWQDSRMYYSSPNKWGQEKR